MFYIAPSKSKRVPGAVFWKEVEEGWIRYDQHSGSTQLLTPLARFVIDFVGKSSAPLSSSDIVGEVLRAEPDAEPGDCHVEVEAVLRILSDAQLIQTLQP